MSLSKRTLVRSNFTALFLTLSLVAACGDQASSSAPEDGVASSNGPGPRAVAAGVDGGAPANPGPGPGPGLVVDGGVLPDGASVVPPAPVDPCPNLPIPTTAFNRNVLYREWSLSATGDGTYFVGQAPYRLGFTRVQNRVWIMKFRTEANSYLGKMSAGADSVAGLTWISETPTDANWALQHKLVALTGHGDSVLDFIVVKDDADANKLATDPALAQWRSMPTLRGDHCYYLGFENVNGFPAGPLDTSFWNSADDCGSTGNGTCWYLGLDVGHLLHDPGTGATNAGDVIAGLTH